MTDTIKTRPDGSIDTQFYMAKGRQARSDAARDMFFRVTPIEQQRPSRIKMIFLPVLACVIAVVALGPSLT